MIVSAINREGRARFSFPSVCFVSIVCDDILSHVAYSRRAATKFDLPVGHPYFGSHKMCETFRRPHCFTATSSSQPHIYGESKKTSFTSLTIINDRDRHYYQAQVLHDSIHCVGYRFSEEFHGSKLPPILLVEANARLMHSAAVIPDSSGSFWAPN